MLAPPTTLPAAPGLPAGTGQPPGTDFTVSDASLPRRRERALEDLATGARRWRLPAALARLDIRNRYRGSVLGPFWLSLSTAIMILALGFLYSALFKMDLASYLPWLAVSLILWNMMAQIVGDACTSLTSSEGIIRQVPLPYTVHALRCVFRNAVVAGHSVPVILLVFLATGHLPGAEVLLALPGLALIAVNGFAVAIFLGMVCARFRDIAQIVASVLQLAFFMSPIIWKPELLGAKQVWLPLNPFYAVMETVRGPLVNGGAAPLVWVSAIGFTALTCIAAYAFFVRFRGRIAFWV